MKIVACNSNRPLAEAVAASLNLPLARASIRRFADMEVFVEVHENVRGEDVFVVADLQQCSPDRDGLRHVESRTEDVGQAGHHSVRCHLFWFEIHPDVVPRGGRRRAAAPTGPAGRPR